MITCARAALAAGDGIVARRDSALLVMPLDGDQRLVEAFMDAAEGEELDAVSELSDELRGERPITFGCVSWGRRVRVALSGVMVVTTDHPTMPMMSAAGSGTWVERSISRLTSAATIRVGVDADLADQWSDLLGGVVRAAGAVISVSPGPTERTTSVVADEAGSVLRDPDPDPAPVPQSADVHPPAPPPPDTPAAPTTSAADAIAADVLSDWGLSSEETPSPVASVPLEPAASDDEVTYVPDVLPELKLLAAETDSGDALWAARPMVDAVACPLCAAPNPVTAGRCQVCDGLMPPKLAGGPTPRPVLGSIVFDDGHVEHLDVGLLIGRNPRVEESLEPCRVVKVAGEKLSRLHLEVRLQNWDVFVVDRASTNGTFVVPYSGAAPLRIEPEVMHRIDPGSLVLFGTHTFRLAGRRNS